MDKRISEIHRKTGETDITIRFDIDGSGKADLSTVVRHIRHICDLGGEHILGFGSDFDGIETTPEGLTGAQDFPALLDALSQAGFSESTIRGFAGENLRSYYSRI